MNQAQILPSFSVRLTCSRVIAVMLLVVGCGLPVQTLAQPKTGGPYDDVVRSIRAAQYKTAERKIDELLAKNLDDHQAHMLRKALGNALVRGDKRDRAEVQFEKFLDYLTSGRDKSRSLLHQMPQILVNIRYLRENEEPKASRTLDKVVEVMTQAVQDEPNNVGYSTGLSTAVNFKARGLQKLGDYAGVERVYSMELKRLRILWGQASESPNNWLRLIYFLKTAASPKNPGYQPFAQKLLLERRNLLQLALAKFPRSNEVVKEYVTDQLSEIGQLQIESPRSALPLLVELQNRVNDIIASRSSPEALIGTKLSVDKAVQGLRRSVNRQSLVGTALPEIEQVLWLQGGDKVNEFPQDSPVAVVFTDTDKYSRFETIHDLREELRKHAVACKLVVIFNDYQQSFLRLDSVKKKNADQFVENRKQYQEQLKEKMESGEGIFRPERNAKLPELPEDGKESHMNSWLEPVGVAKDSGRVATLFGIDKLPFVVMLDRNGICRQTESGKINVGNFLAAMKRIGEQ